MNIIKNIILGSSLLLALTSCGRDILDKSPVNQLPPRDYLTNDGAYRNALDGIYAAMKGDLTAYSYSYLSLTEGISDNLTKTGSGFLMDGSHNSIYPLTYNSGNFILSGFWGASYRGISGANVIITEAKKSSLANAPEYLAEAMAARSYIYFNLYRIFAPSYSSNPDALSVVYMTEADNPLVPKQRITSKELFTNIINDLTFAESKLKNTVNNYRISLTAVYAMLSKIYMETGEYAKAADYASKALSDTRYNIVTTRSALVDLWQKDANSPEIIFKLRYDTNETSNSGIFGIPDYFSYPYNVSTELYDSYEAADYRKTAYFTANPTKPGKFVTHKYVTATRGVNPSTYSLGVIDIKLIRVPEILMIRAEANARQSKFAEALADLNRLKTARNATIYSGSNTGLIDAILLEKRKELAFEGTRFTDLKRLKMPLVREDGTTLPANSPKFALPIPQREIDLGKLTQNPGY